MQALLAHLARGREVGATSCQQGAARLCLCPAAQPCPNQEELVALGSGIRSLALGGSKSVCDSRQRFANLLCRPCPGIDPFY